MPAVRRLPAAPSVLPAAGLAHTGWASPTEGGGDAAADVPTVGTDSPCPPFGFEQEGGIVGFDMALAEELAADDGVGKTVGQANLEPLESGAALNTARCEVAIAGTTSTGGRRSVVDFSAPDLNDGLALLTAVGSGARSFEVLGVAVQEGDTAMLEQADRAPARIQEDGALERVHTDWMGL